MILTDSFTSSQFKQSFVRVFDKDSNDSLLMGFNASLEVLTTKELKVTGLIGHAVSLEQEVKFCRRNRVWNWQHLFMEDVWYQPYFKLRDLLRNSEPRRTRTAPARASERHDAIPDVLPAFVWPISSSSYDSGSEFEWTYRRSCNRPILRSRGCRGPHVSDCSI